MSVIQYAVADGDTHIAYRVMDAEPDSPGHDIVMVSGGLIPLEVFDDDAGLQRMLEGLCRLGRLVVFDRRGIGLSDPIVDWSRPILDQWADDLAAVVDTVGVERPVIFSWDGFGVAPRFVARHPERVERLVLFQPMGADLEQWKMWLTQQILEQYQDADLLTRVAPSRAHDPSFREWYERAGRVGASPATAGRIWDSVVASPPGDIFEHVSTPTLIIHRPNMTQVPDESVQWVLDRRPDATVVEVDGEDLWPFVGDVDAVIAEIGQFVTGERRVPPPDRLLAAVLFTDLVDSTRRAADLGDREWKHVLDRHDRAIRNAVGRCGGQVVKTTGDGVLALFPAAGAAVRSAERMQAELALDDLQIRVGIHVGDIDRRGDDVSGLAVNLAARVMSKAPNGHIAVTSSVVAAAAGQAMHFEPIGSHELKGIPGTWELFQVVQDA